MKLEDTVLEDTQVLQRWIDADLEHRGGYAIWWMTGNGLLAFKLTDAKGAVCFVRLDKDQDNRVVIHTQFAPTEEVGRIRLLKGMLWCVPTVVGFADSQKAKGLVFSSRSESLITFMKKRFSFVSVGNDRYVFDFETGE